MDFRRSQAMTAVEGELDDAFERGRAVGFREGRYGPPLGGLPAFAPLTRGVRFAFERSWFDSFVAYERSVLEQLRLVQRERWLESQLSVALWDKLEEAEEAVRTAPDELRSMAWRRRWALRVSRPWLSAVAEVRSEVERQEHSSSLLERMQRRIEQELRAARLAVDAELDTGRGQACTVEAMRGPPLRPAGVREFRSVRAFVAQDDRRARTQAGPLDLGGEDYGARWRLENPVRRWDTTRWRVSWLCVEEETRREDPTYEVYAVELLDEPAGTSDGRVWLMGTIQERKVIATILPELERHASGESNSLVVVAARISEVTAATGRARSPDEGLDRGSSEM
jgi:hypothetical protein